MKFQFKCSDIPPISEPVECGALPESYWRKLTLELPPSSPEDRDRTGPDFIAKCEGLYKFEDPTYEVTLVPYYRRKDKIYCKIKGTDIKAVVCHA